MLKTVPTANADGSVVVTGGFIVGVGVLANDVQHGNLANGNSIHADATNAVAGFFSGAQKTALDGLVAGTISASSFFGDGADGAVTIGTAAVAGPATRATTLHATGNVTPVVGDTGMILRATGTTTVDGGASFNADGLGTAGTAGGAAGANGTAKSGAAQTQCFANPATVAGGTAGAAGANPGGNGGNAGNGNPGNTFQGGTGGGGGGSGGGVATGGAAGGAGGAQNVGGNFDDFRWARVRWDPLMLPSFVATTSGIIVGVGGAGGGGGGTGGGGGGAGGPGASGATATGAGFVYLCSPAITGTGRISANGTAGVTGTNGTASGVQGGGGGGGGSGGGAGGSVSIKTKSLGGGLTVQANGGAGGALGTGAAGGAGAGAGGNGGNGGNGGAGIVETAILA